MFLNIDETSTVCPFLLGLEGKENLTEKDFYPFVDVFKNTKVSDILFNIIPFYGKFFVVSYYSVIESVLP